MTTLIVVLVLVALVVVFAVGLYNGLVGKRNAVKNYAPLRPP